VLTESVLEKLLDGLLMAVEEPLEAEDVTLDEALPLDEAEEETLENDEELALEEDELALDDDELALNDDELTLDEEELALDEDELVLEEVLDATEEEDELDEEQVGGVGVSEKTLMELISQNLSCVRTMARKNHGIHTHRRMSLGNWQPGPCKISIEARCLGRSEGSQPGHIHHRHQPKNHRKSW
jgi:hypothetical protein